MIGSAGRFWRRHFLGAEFLLAAAVTVVFALWVDHFEGAHTMQRLLKGQRTALYGSLAAIDGGLLGFITATTAIVLGYAHDERFTVLRGSAHYRTLWRTFLSTIRFLGLATVTALAALLIDQDRHPNWPTMVVCAGTTTLAILRVARSVWILEHVIKIVTRADPEPLTSDPR